MTPPYETKSKAMTFFGLTKPLVAAFLMALFSIEAFAEIGTTEVEIPIQIPSSTKGTLEFNVHVRIHTPPEGLRNADLPPVILTHGIINSDGIVQKLARHLTRRGFVVWTYNQPGFGQQGRVTQTVHEPTRGEYGLTSLSGVVGSLIETVTRQSGRKPIFIGYSLGGVALEMHLHGLTGIRQDGRLILSPHSAVHRQKSLAKAVFISTPTLATDDMPRGLRLLYESAKCANCVFGHRDGFLDLGFGRERSLTGLALGLSSTLTPELVMRGLFQDVTVWENLDPESRKLAEYLKSNFSNIHTDLIRDLAAAAKHIDEAKLSPLRHVATVQVVGSRDKIADPKKIESTHRDRLRHSPQHELLIADGVGHLDILENKVLDSGLAENLISRLQKQTGLPNKLGRCEASFRFLGTR